MERFLGHLAAFLCALASVPSCEGEERQRADSRSGAGDDASVPSSMDDDGTTDAPVTVLPPDPAPAGVAFAIVPPSIDIGRVSQCDAPAPHRVTLVNRLDRPLRIVEWKSTCGCTSPLGIVPGSVLAPLERKVIDLRIEPYGTGLKRQRIDFLGDGRTLLASLLIDYEIVSPIRSQPSSVTRSHGEATELHLLAGDDAPFRVLGSVPDVVRPIADESVSYQRMRIDWTALDAEMRRRGQKDWKVTTIEIATDREDCGSVFVLVKNIGGEGSLVR